MHWFWDESILLVELLFITVVARWKAVFSLQLRRAQHITDRAYDFDPALGLVQFVTDIGCSLEPRVGGLSFGALLLVPVLLDVELVGPTLVLVEKEDGLGCKVVDSDNLGGLHRLGDGVPLARGCPICR